MGNTYFVGNCSVENANLFKIPKLPLHKVTRNKRDLFLAARRKK